MLWQRHRVDQHRVPGSGKSSDAPFYFVRSFSRWPFALGFDGEIRTLDDR